MHLPPAPPARHPLPLPIAGSGFGSVFACCHAEQTRPAPPPFQALFECWLAVLQKAGKQLPYKAENWETVAGGGWPLASLTEGQPSGVQWHSRDLLLSACFLAALLRMQPHIHLLPELHVHQAAVPHAPLPQ